LDLGDPALVVRSVEDIEVRPFTSFELLVRDALQ
jgi:hypothetical protein